MLPDFTSWQDLVFTFGSLFFALALVPMIKALDKPPMRSSLMTALFLLLFSIADYSLGLYLAGVFNLMTVGAWAILFWQRLRQVYDFAFVGYSHFFGHSDGYCQLGRLVVWRIYIPDEVPIHGY